MIGRGVAFGKKPNPARRSAAMVLTVYFALVASSSPSLSQLIIGLGFPWAEQLSRVLPPSFASTYCGGVAVNEGGAAERVRVGGSFMGKSTFQQQCSKSAQTGAGSLSVAAHCMFQP